MGIGKYSSKINNKPSPQYSSWSSMIKRCYNPKCLTKDYTYQDCSVCKEWHNFQNFAKWYDDNYYQVFNEEINLDKDILHKGNKIYSPENCIFVPKTINSLFTKSNRSRGKYPIGVDYNKGMRKFRARSRKDSMIIQ